MARPSALVNMDEFPDAINSTNRKHAKACVLWPLLRCVAVAVALYGGVVVVEWMVWCGVCVWCVRVRVVCMLCSGLGFHGVVCGCVFVCVALNPQIESRDR